jgi:hypothetical protein
MPYLQLSDFQENYKDNRVKIMIFTEGTVLGPQNVFGHFNHAAYVTGRQEIIDKAPFSG